MAVSCNAFVTQAQHKVSGQPKGAHGHQVDEIKQRWDLDGIFYRFKSRQAFINSCHGSQRWVPVVPSHPLSLKVSINCRGLLTSTSGHILAQDQPLMSTPEKPTLHPMDKPTSLHLLLSLSSSLPLLSENSILGRTFRTHAFLSSFGEANTLRGISMRVFDYTLGVGFVGKLWEVRPL